MANLDIVASFGRGALGMLVLLASPVVCADMYAPAPEPASSPEASAEMTVTATPSSSASPTDPAPDSSATLPAMAPAATSAVAGVAPATSGEQDCLARDRHGDLLGWADYPHCLVDYRTQSTVRWIDDWFGQPNVGTDSKATAAVRAITEMVIDDRGRVTPAVRLRARLSLPKISRRLSLVFEDESQDGNRLRSVPTVNEAVLALRLLVLNLERLQIETDAGVRSGPDLFARARVRKSWAISSDDQFSVRQTVRYGVREKLRAINEIDFMHAFNDDTVGTIYHNLDHQEEDNDRGMFWSRGLLLSHMLNKNSTMATGFGQEGVTQPSWETTSRFVWVRYRQRFLRDWLFYEVEPRLTQTRERDWDTLPSLALRLEVLFGQHTSQAFSDRLRPAMPAGRPVRTENTDPPMP